MDFKDTKYLTNNEIGLYKMELENEYEKTKTDITKLCDYLEKLDREYSKVENEQRIRQNSIYK